MPVLIVSRKMVCLVRSENKPAESCPGCGKPILTASQPDGIDANIAFLANLRKVLMSKNVQLRLVVPDPDHATKP